MNPIDETEATQATVSPSSLLSKLRFYQHHQNAQTDARDRAEIAPRLRDIISQRSPPIPPAIPKPKKTACPDTFLSTFTDFSNPPNRSEHRWNTLRFYTGVLSPKPQKTPDATPITPSGFSMVCGTPTAPEAAATTRTSSPPPALDPASFFAHLFAPSSEP